jgi:hypothetical protein
VWEGRRREASPYPDPWHIAAVSLTSASSFQEAAVSLTSASSFQETLRQEPTGGRNPLAGASLATCSRPAGTVLAKVALAAFHVSAPVQPCH